jgi:hypothetical protein
MMNGKLLKATARGAIAGACIGIAGAFVIGLGFLEALHKIPDFLWDVFPVVIWERFLPLEVLVVVASAVYSIPISTALTALTRFLLTAAYSTEANQ